MDLNSEASKYKTRNVNITPVGAGPASGMVYQE